MYVYVATEVQQIGVLGTYRRLVAIAAPDQLVSKLVVAIDDLGNENLAPFDMALNRASPAERSEKHVALDVFAKQVFST